MKRPRSSLAREEVVDQMIFFGTGALDRSLAAYEVFHNQERPHHGVGNSLIAPRGRVGSRNGPVQVRERLGGMLRFYYRRAGGDLKHVVGAGLK